MSSVLALGAAELSLAAALTRLGDARSEEERQAAEAAVARARKQLERVRSAAPVQERTCCGRPLIFLSGVWKCAAGHD